MRAVYAMPWWLALPYVVIQFLFVAVAVLVTAMVLGVVLVVRVCVGAYK